MLSWLKGIWNEAQKRKRYPGPYKAFTTAHDQEIRFTTRAEVRARIDIALAHYPQLELDAYLSDCVPLYESSAAQMVAAAAPEHADLAVTLLLDHSGSLRGETSFRLAAIAGIYSECLSRLNIQHEVLAYTTSTWHGGRSNQDWKKQGRPPQPGRVCDLLHIIYRAFDDDGPITYDAIRMMSDPYLLKENVDGEALEWGVRRLCAAAKARRVLIVISDGAPVDDATLTANGPNILDDHLRLVTQDVVHNGEIELYGLGLGYQMFRYYPQYAVVRTDKDIGEIAIPILGAIIATGAHAPTAEQVARR